VCSSDLPLLGVRRGLAPAWRGHVGGEFVCRCLAAFEHTRERLDPSLRRSGEKGPGPGVGSTLPKMTSSKTATPPPNCEPDPSLTLGCTLTLAKPRTNGLGSRGCFACAPVVRRAPKVSRREPSRSVDRRLTTPREGASMLVSRLAPTVLVGGPGSPRREADTRENGRGRVEGYPLRGIQASGTWFRAAELQEARIRSGRLGGRPRKPTVEEARRRRPPQSETQGGTVSLAQHAPRACPLQGADTSVRRRAFRGVGRSASTECDVGASAVVERAWPV